MKLFRTILFIITFYTFASPVFAEEPRFAVSQENKYLVREDGNTTVTEHFTFTNLTSQYYPQEYIFKPDELKILNLTASDRLGTLIRNQNTFKFNDQVVGIGKILHWNLSFTTPDITKKIGRLWKINIPPINKLPGLTSLTVKLDIPHAFGIPVYIKPEPKTAELSWDNLDIGSRPIEAVFDPQTEDNPFAAYNFKFKYHLYNSRLYPVIFELALPANTNYQAVMISSLSPKPLDVINDSAGNWLAQYQLGPTSRLEVVATGAAAIYFYPNESTFEDQSPEKYLKIANNFTVSQKLTSLEDIYLFTQKNLEYDPAKSDSQRVGIRAKLISGKNSTMYDFSDMFINVARNFNVPARQVDGYLLKIDTKRHVWSEYYDAESKKWRMVDPGLGSITGTLDFFKNLDFDHFSVYKENGQNRPIFPDGVEILPVNIFPKNITAMVTASLNFPTKITSGFPGNGKITVENLGPVVFLPQTVAISANNLNFINQVFITKIIPPFGRQEFEIHASQLPFFVELNDIITLRFGLEKHDYPIVVTPLYKNIYLVILGGLIFFGIISIVTQITRSLSLSRSPRKNNIRGEGEKSS